jgi:hypothetical protein
VQSQDGYFVRLGEATAPETPSRFAGPDDHDYELPKPRRRRTQFKLRPLTVLGLVIVGWLVWAATTEGGVGARLEDYGDAIQGLVDDATTDPGLKRAATYFDERYEATGGYPQMSAAQLDDVTKSGFGVAVTWCNDQAGGRVGRAPVPHRPLEPRALEAAGRRRGLTARHLSAGGGAVPMR